jgi:non-homologous end joining protein Ku
MAGRTSKKPSIPEGVALTKQRAYLSEINVSLGLLNVSCDFVPAKATDNSVKLKVICPHEDHGNQAIQPGQAYLCQGHTAEDLVRRVLADASISKVGDLRAKLTDALKAVHGPYTSAEAARAREVDKVLHKVTPEEIAELRSDATDENDITEGAMALASSPREQVEAAVLPSGTVYRLRPRNTSFQAYSVLMDAIEATSSDFVTYGEVIARETQKLFVLSVFTDAEGVRQIIAQETLRPGDMADLDKVTVPYPDTYATMAVDVIKTNAVDFDAASYINQRKERAAELDERLRSEGGTAVATQAARAADPNNGSDDLLAALQASLAATKKAS